MISDGPLSPFGKGRASLPCCIGAKRENRPFHIFICSQSPHHREEKKKEIKESSYYKQLLRLDTQEVDKCWEDGY